MTEAIHARQAHPLRRPRWMRAGTAFASVLLALAGSWGSVASSQVRARASGGSFCDALLEAMPDGDGWWVAIPGGSPAMGSESGREDERPVHPFTLSAFAIGRTEVTQGLYRVCVEAGRCTAPTEEGGPTRRRHPVTAVTHPQAQEFCRFAGGALPTETQWELAAGGGDGRLHPRGNQDERSRLNVGLNRRASAPRRWS